MDPINLPFNLRDALICLGFFVGIVGGIFLIIRRQTVAGGLAIAGFVLFSLDPITEVFLFRVLGSATENFEMLNWTYACIGGPATFLGVVALIAALIVLVRSQSQVSNL